LSFGCRSYLIGPQTRRHPRVLLEGTAAVVVGLRVPLEVQLLVVAVVEPMTRDRRRRLVAGGAEGRGHRVEGQVAGRLAVAALQRGDKVTR